MKHWYSYAIAGAIASIVPLLAFPGATHSIATEDSVEKCRGEAVLQTDGSCAGDGISEEEQKLYELFDAYRKRNNLPSVPLSPSLSIVANRHLLDTTHNNMHGHNWSNCAYDAEDNLTWPCMWTAPQRLGTAYTGKGYEIWARNGRIMTAAQALSQWQGSPSHNAVMLNLRNWRRNPWQAVGIAIYDKQAAMWFGKLPDPAIAPTQASANVPSNDGQNSPTPEPEPTPTPEQTPEPIPPSARSGSFENTCPHPIRLALRHMDLQGEWVTKAWWNFESGGRGVLDTVKTDNGVAYYYAEATDGSGLTWTGPNRQAWRGETLDMAEVNLVVQHDGNLEFKLECGS